MKTYVWFPLTAIVFVLAAWSTPLSADSIPLFVYQFPASSSNMDPGGVIVNDLGSGNHDATPGWFSGTGLSTDVPTGMSGNSVDFGGTGDLRTIFTADRRLLNTPDVATYGGFVADLWFKPTDGDLNGGRHKLVDYDGTEVLEIYNNKLLFRTSETAYQVYSDVLTADTWYHATAVFDTLGNSAVPDPAHSGFQMVSGQLNLYLNDALVGSLAGVKGGYGDEENVQIGLGNIATGSTSVDFDGLMYNPQVWLGTAIVPEPSMVVLMATGLIGLLCYAWRKRK